MSNPISQLKEKYCGKRILVVGLGLQGSGIGAVKFFSELGAAVTVTDLKNKEQLKSSIDELKQYNVRFSLGGHKVEDFINTDVILKGPGVRWDRPEIKAAQEKGIPIEMESALFAAFCPAPIVGITGTRGKSTTTSMIYEVLKLTGRHVHLAGNIPQVSTILLLEKIHSDDIVVMELSSFQLSGFHAYKISPHIAVFTSFYPDHLNYYSSMDDYFHDKSAIYAYQTEKDFLIAHNSLQERIENDKPHSRVTYYSSSEFPAEFMYLRGVHNKRNAAAALHVSSLFNIPKNDADDTLKNFKNLSYRQAVVAEKNGVTFINDTTSTTPIAAVAAINSFSDKPIIHILGGNSKNLPYAELMEVLQSVEKIVLLKGSFTDEIYNELKKRYSDKLSPVFDDLEKAIKYAYTEAKKYKETYVLFSPAATSFAMFNNEFHRGDYFNSVVNSLIPTS
jgi:UDP-N-acetylmuramoylalanine--D-glutamate ligase